MLRVMTRVSVLTWGVSLLIDAGLLRILPGLELDNWPTALGVGLVLQVGTWPAGLLSGVMDTTNQWIILGVACAVDAVIITIAMTITSGIRASRAWAAPIAAALIVGVNDFVVPAVVGQMVRMWHGKWF
jgi:hypothetical protein